MKLAFLLFALIALGAARADDLAARVIILANARQPESVALGKFYAEQRRVPVANVIALPMPEEESITWRQFIDQVYQPLQDELYRRGWIEGTASNLLDRFGRRRYAPVSHSISYLVTCRGVPLRIYNDPMLLTEKPGSAVAVELRKNEGAVDSELSLLAFGNYEITGLITNPLFAHDGLLTLDAAQVVKVSRLDGPSWESARHLVLSALEAERVGLHGRYCVDLGGPNPSGDVWLESAQRQLEAHGFSGETEHTGATLNPVGPFVPPVFYFGWYAPGINGPFTREDFVFPPGAIALHIHSFSAETLHSATQGWAGPLVARGAAATFGNVFEPYLQFTHRPDLLLKALLAGRTLGEAAYYALPALSWQAVTLGDPLYRPFGRVVDQTKKPAAEPRAGN